MIFQNFSWPEDYRSKREKGVKPVHPDVERIRRYVEKLIQCSLDIQIIKFAAIFMNY